MSKELKKVTKKAKTAKVAKSTKPAKAIKATKTTKPAKETKSSKKELSAKDRKKVTGGRNVNNSFGTSLLVGLCKGLDMKTASLDHLKGARAQLSQQDLKSVEQELLAAGYSPAEIEIIISETQSNSGM